MKWLDVKKSLPANPGWVITCYDGYHGAELCWYESYCFYIKHKTKYHKICKKSSLSKDTYDFWCTLRFKPRP